MNGITRLSRRARDTNENVTDFTNQGCGFRQYSKQIDVVEMHCGRTHAASWQQTDTLCVATTDV